MRRRFYSTYTNPRSYFQLKVSKHASQASEFRRCNHPIEQANAIEEENISGSSHLIHHRIHTVAVQDANTNNHWVVVVNNDCCANS